MNVSELSENWREYQVVPENGKGVVHVLKEMLAG